MGTILYDLNGTLNSVAQCRCGCVFVYTPIDISQYEMMDPNTKKYKNGQKGAEYGRLGGRPRKEKTPVGLSQETPNVNENANVNVNENANVNVTANDNVSDSCVDGLQKIINFYNNNIGMIPPYRI